MHGSPRPRLDTGARSARRLVVATIVAAAVATTPPARADLVKTINAMRRNECAAPAAAATLRADKTLDDLAHELARGKSLPAAIKSVDYPAEAAQSLHVKGATSEDAVRRELAKHYCKEVSDGRYTGVGVYHARDDYWMVLGARKVEPPPLDPVAVARRVLELVNAARAVPRDCGKGNHFEAAEPVIASAVLAHVALLHSRDMAAQRTLGHPGSDGSTPSERVTRGGYDWRGTGENVASGQQTADAVVAAWLTSPGHCVNIMEPRFTEMGVAFALAPGQNPDIYWTQVFATPR